MSNEPEVIEAEIDTPELIAAPAQIDVTPGEARRFGGAAPAPIPEPEQDQFLSMVSAVASNPDIPVEKMQLILDMKNSEEDRAAKRAFNAAMAQIAEEMVPVIARSENDQTSSRYAKLGPMISAAGPIMGRHGISIRYYELDGAAEGCVKVGATVSHSHGYSEDYFREIPLDGAGLRGNTNKTPIHANQSAFTYGQRYVFAAIMNIPVLDDDGNAAGADHSVISQKELAIVQNVLADIGLENIDLPKFFAVLGMPEDTSAKDIPKSKFDLAMKTLNAKRRSLRGEK